MTTRISFLRSISAKKKNEKRKKNAGRLVMFLVSIKEVCMNDTYPKGIRYHMSGFVFG